MNERGTDKVIYNVTIAISWAIHEDWLTWMQDLHIPQILGTGCFEKHQLVRLLETDEEHGPTYAVQYYASSKQYYDQYTEHYAAALRKQASEKWGENAVYFRSLMQIVQ